MALHGYGLLIGKIIASRAQRSGSPHLLLMVQPKKTGHPPYRVAVNLQSTDAAAPRDIQYQVVDINRAGTPQAKALVKQLRKLGPTDSFITADSTTVVPRLDFVRGGVIDPAAFQDVPAGQDPYRSAFEAALARAAKAGAGKVLVAVFGTGYPMNHTTGEADPTGFTGVDNVHMNQGSMHLVNGGDYYLENGPNQDGGIIFLFPSGAQGFFVKFQSQTLHTGADGQPTVTGIQKLDKTPAKVRNAIMPPPAAPAAKKAAAAPTVTPSTATTVVEPPQGGGQYVFADPDPDHSLAPFTEDDDQMFKTPFVVKYGKGTTRGPVPTPLGYPTMQLTDATGSQPPGYTRDVNSETIEFDLIGDSGAPRQSKLAGEMQVTELLSADAAKKRPAFLFHLGDVVYYYGEKDYYYSQFADPFKDYPAPIFAIPGNHDAVTYNDSMVSLDAFQKAFCATQPGRWDGFGGILRSTMTQPGVYFTLDAPLVSIIGLYSNCAETLGWLDQQQLLFLYHELVRLKAKKQADGRAVILAIHHCPRWFPNQPKPDATNDAIDRAFQQAGFQPDAVVCGHAHLYQKIVRQDQNRDLPYLILGNGGYGLSALQVVAKDYMAQIKPQGPKIGSVVVEEGYVHVTVSKPAQGAATLKFEMRSTKAGVANPRDTCTIDLSSNQLA